MFKRFLVHLITYLPAKLLPALTGFITAPILTRLLLPAEYASYILASGLASLLFALACSGLASGIVRFLPPYTARGEQHIFFAILGICAGALILGAASISAGVLWLARPMIPTAIYPMLQVSLGVFVAESMYTFLLLAILAQERSKVYTTFQIVVTYLGLGLGLSLIIGLGFRGDGLLWGSLIAFAVAIPPLLTLTMRGIAPPRLQDFSASGAVDLWRYAWPLAVGNVAMWGLTISDRYVIGFFHPAAEVGLYSVAYNITGKSIDIIVSIFMLSTAPLIINVWEQHGRSATEDALAMITRLFLIIGFPAAAGLTVLALPFVALLTAPAYHPGYTIVGYVAFSSFAYGLSQMASMGLLIGMATRKVALNQLIAAAVNIALNLALVPRFGFVAAGVTTLIGYCVLLVLQARSSRRTLSWRFPHRTLRNVVLASACMSLVVIVIYPWPSTSESIHIGQLLLSVAAAVPAYAVTLVGLGELSGEERRLALDFGRRVVSKASFIRL